MRGDGTVESPYIPESATEFVQAVGTSGAYVKIDGTINFEDDVDYNQGFTRITFNCARVYSDTRGVINGMKPTGIDALTFNANTVVENIDFFNIIYTGTAFIYGSEAFEFRKCNFSARFMIGSNIPNFGGHLYDCSVYLEAVMISGTSMNQHIGYTFNGLERCAIEIHNFPASGGFAAGIEQCTIYGDILAITNRIGIDNSRNSCVALEINNPNNLETITLALTSGGQSRNPSILDTEILADYITISADSGFRLLETEKMKDLEYLGSAEIGFLP